MPQPSAVISVPTSADCSILSKPRLLDVQYLSFQGQYCLGAAITALFGRAAGRISLDEKQLRERGVFFLAIGQFAGQACNVESAFTARHLARLTGRFARPRRIDDLRDDGLGFLRVLEQELFQPPRHRLLDDAP